MLSEIKRQIEQTSGVHDWSLRAISKKSTQHYVIGDRTESRRQVTTERVLAHVLNDHAGANGDGMFRGETLITLLESDRPRLSARLSDAVFMASLSDNPVWSLPGASSYPEVAMTEPEIQTNPHVVAEQLIAQVGEALRDKPGVRLSSAEAFVEEERVEFLNSQGAQGSQVATHVMLEMVLLAAGHGDEMESNIGCERRRARDLDVADLVDRHAQYARDALVATAPTTGTYPVVVSDEALDELLMGGGDSPLVFGSSAQARYQKMTSWQPGQSIFKEAPVGEPFTFFSNALLPYGVRSRAVEDDGLPAQRLLVVKDGILEHLWGPSRYAEYLQLPATGAFGNMEIGGGSQSYDALLSEPGPLYHIVSFSAMSPDPITGDFVGEIRLGYELRSGQRRPVRGGSISGNLLSALAAARWSSETAFLGSYHGPRAAYFPQITVAGA